MGTIKTQTKYTFNLFLVGGCDVGKTDLLVRFVENTFGWDNPKTSGIDIRVRTVSFHDKKIELLIGDVPGGEISKFFSRTHYNADGYLVAYDVSNLQSFENAKVWIENIEKSTTKKHSTILVGNKSDLSARKVPVDLAKKYAKTKEIPVFEVSAKTGQNVEAAFNSLIGNICKIWELHLEQLPNLHAETKAIDSKPNASKYNVLGKLLGLGSPPCAEPQTKYATFMRNSGTAPPARAALASPSHAALASPSHAATAPPVRAGPVSPSHAAPASSAQPHRHFSDCCKKLEKSVSLGYLQVEFTKKPGCPPTYPIPLPSLAPYQTNIEIRKNPGFGAYHAHSSSHLTDRRDNTPHTHGVLMIPSSQIEIRSDLELGAGSQGIVYLAKWKSKDVVFKKLFCRQQDAQQKKDFLCELEVWKNIRHPNAVSLFGAVEDSGKVGYVMEYCPNGNLHDHMKRGLILSPIKTIEIAWSVADILSHLHHSGIAHRDVKSANIMLDKDFRPKLGDFGLSRMLTPVQALATNLSGTPTHMAPEQFVSGARHNPLRADVYSFGMLMYELATNKFPFTGYNLIEISRKLEQGERPKIQQEMPIGMEENERTHWWNIVRKCWAQAPSARPLMEEVSELLSDLKKDIAKRVQGFCCKQHKVGIHDYFLSYRVATESNTVHSLYNTLSQVKRKSGDSIKVFLDAKCLPDAEDWQKSFLYGLHHTKIIVPVISAAGLAHFHKAHEENDNVLLEYEHMLSLLTLQKGNIKVYPIFIDAFPRACDFPDKPHITTGKNIRKTLEGITRLQGRRVSSNSIEEVVPALLEKLDELETGLNTSLTIVGENLVQAIQESTIGVFIQIEGEAPRNSSIEVSPSVTLQYLRTLIADQLDDFDFEFKFLYKSSGRVSTVSIKQESMKTIQDIADHEFNILVQKI